MFKYERLPENLREGMRLYVERGIKPGSFLSACLANDFIGAVGTASDQSFEYLHSVGMFLYNELPGRGPDSPWGSLDNINNWKGMISTTSEES